jgi:hypothetical protein
LSESPAKKREKAGSSSTSHVEDPRSPTVETDALQRADIRPVEREILKRYFGIRE